MFSHKKLEDTELSASKDTMKTSEQLKWNNAALLQATNYDSVALLQAINYNSVALLQWTWHLFKLRWHDVYKK